ncbi:MAG: 5-formyltetrahydrofolate cyclo-ligase [Nocardioidaceae bacterium]|nr:5-formyltetrahydrofolate cyclo-ligase [Nocardioidaceae bacterium]
MVEKATDTWPAKRRLRFRLLASRARRTGEERAAASEALCRGLVELPEVGRADTVACYVSTAEEPGTGPFIEWLLALGRTVLLPVLRPDFDLDWAAHQRGALRGARFGISEPTGTELGVEAVAAADVVVCPGLAADHDGNRIGRGGGSYDRVLARLPGAVLRVTLLYDDEVLAAVPVDSHDQPIDVVVTPTRTLRMRDGRDAP